MSESNAEHNADHIYHCWINKRQEGKQSDWEHSLYEFKDMLQFLQYGHKQIAEAFTGELPTTHKQCSRCESEPIKDNTLTCCLGKNVTTCDILVSLKSTVESERDRVAPYSGEKSYSNVTDEYMYRLMARTCAWHIYKTSCDIKDGHNFKVDTSEGYLLTKGDRMFWDNVYRSMAGE